MSSAHHPRQLCPDPAAPFPHLLPGPSTYLHGGQAGEPEPEEGGDRRGEGAAAAFRYQAGLTWGGEHGRSTRGIWGDSFPSLLTPLLFLRPSGEPYGFPDGTAAPRMSGLSFQYLHTMRGDYEKSQLKGIQRGLRMRKTSMCMAWEQGRELNIPLPFLHLEKPLFRDRKMVQTTRVC